MTFVPGQLLTADEMNALLPMSTTSDASYQLGIGLYLTIIDSDVWITTNAWYIGGQWQRIETGLPAFALNFQNFHPIPGETSTYGVLFWSAAAGPNPIGPITTIGGWNLLLGMTNFKDLVCGGYGIEVDGNGTTVSGYGRFIHQSVGNVSPARTGVLTNLFADLSNVDVNTAPSWFAGIKDDAFVVERANPGGTVLTSLLSVNASGNTTIAGNLFVNRNPSTTSAATETGTVLASSPPTSSTSAGSEGTITWDANYLYVCTATNTWKRAALTTF